MAHTILLIAYADEAHLSKRADLGMIRIVSHLHVSILARLAKILIFEKMEPVTMATTNAHLFRLVQRWIIMGKLNPESIRLIQIDRDGQSHALRFSACGEIPHFDWSFFNPTLEDYL